MSFSCSWTFAISVSILASSSLSASPLAVSRSFIKSSNASLASFASATSIPIKAAPNDAATQPVPLRLFNVCFNAPFIPPVAATAARNFLTFRLSRQFFHILFSLSKPHQLASVSSRERPPPSPSPPPAPAPPAAASIAALFFFPASISSSLFTEGAVGLGRRSNISLNKSFLSSASSINLSVPSKTVSLPIISFSFSGSANKGSKRPGFFPAAGSPGTTFGVSPSSLGASASTPPPAKAFLPRPMIPRPAILAPPQRPLPSSSPANNNGLGTIPSNDFFRPFNGLRLDTNSLKTTFALRPISSSLAARFF